jgi:hypothetical protein
MDVDKTELVVACEHTDQCHALHLDYFLDGVFAVLGLFVEGMEEYSGIVGMCVVVGGGCGEPRGFR